jgi:hypothetical protein
MTKKIDANTLEFVGKKVEKDVGGMQVTVSEDGKTRTLTEKGTNPKGQRYSATWICEQ